MKLYRIFTMGILMMGMALMMGSCVPSNKRFLSNFEQFVVGITDNCSEMTAEEWTKANDKYDEFMEEYEKRYSSSFSWKENQRFGELRSDYSKAVFKGLMDDSERVMGDGLEIVEGIVDDRDVVM